MPERTEASDKLVTYIMLFPGGTQNAISTHEIRPVAGFVSLCRRSEWLLESLPIYIQKCLLGNHRILSRKFYYHEVLKSVKATQRHDLSHYIGELRDNKLLRRNYLHAVEQSKIPNKHKLYDDRFSNEANIVNYYALIREIKPNIICETGTASGSMTSWLLAALEANGKGKVISIDIPPIEGKLTMDRTIKGDEIRFLILLEYHHRWDYLAGDAKVLLPKVLADNEIDVFVHDSLHTRTHMLFKYNVARCLMKPGTVILSDDILWNNAFFSFIESHNMTGV